jgi:DNA transposition AAA+ family ATPase
MTDQTINPERVVRLANDYVNRSGMSPYDFARRVGYAYPTMHMFLAGKYGQLTGADPAKMAEAVLDFIQRYPLDCTDIIGQTIYETETVRMMRKVFKRLLERPQIFLVYAPPGSGKTDVARHLIAQHNAQHGPDQDQYIFRIYCRARITPRDLLRRVAAACGTEAHSAIDRAIHNLRWDYRGKRVALYFDEAQHLSIDCLETVRELLDEDPRFSLCFAGSHDLDRIFARFAGTLEQLERRITDKITLPAVTADEAAGILRSELAGISIDQATVRQQIELATISVRVERKAQRYISIGRLMAAIREIREGLAPVPDAPEKVEAIA